MFYLFIYAVSVARLIEVKYGLLKDILNSKSRIRTFYHDSDVLMNFHYSDQ